MTLTPNQVQDQIIHDFLDAGDPLGQFDHLLQYAYALPAMPEADRVDEVLVKGCQSQVWLYVDWVDGKMNIRADSDTLMVRGVISIFKKIFDGRTPQEIVDVPLHFVEETELDAIFDPQRKAGVASIAKAVFESARNQMEQ